MAGRCLTTHPLSAYSARSASILLNQQNPLLVLRILLKLRNQLSLSISLLPTPTVLAAFLPASNFRVWAITHVKV